MTNKSNREKLWGLCLTAAMEINHHPEIGVTPGGSESGRDVVEMMRVLIFNTIVDGMGFVEPEAPAPAPAPAPVTPAPIPGRCNCGHWRINHFENENMGSGCMIGECDCRGFSHD